MGECYTAFRSAFAINLALNRPVTQSSLFSICTCTTGARAVDGHMWLKTGRCKIGPDRTITTFKLYYESYYLQ